MNTKAARGRSLEEVTRELLTLQTISNAMISTSYLDDVLQIIVEGLEKGLNYDAGVLFITEQSTQSLYPHLTHRNKFIQVLEERLGCSFSSLSIAHNVKQNLLAQSIRERKILTTEYLDEVLQGAVNLPPNLGDLVTRETGVKKYVVVPMVIRSEVAGVILCATSHPDILPPEIESLKNFANQACLALDNTQIMNSLKSAQRELSEKNEHLNKAYKDLRDLEALKDGLVGMVVHDLKNPLTSVRGYLELILETTQDEPEKKTLINFIKKAYESSEDLLKMIHNLLDISRMEDGKFTLNRTNCMIQDVLSTVYEQMEVVAKQNQRVLVLEKNEALPQMEIDFDIMQRVVGNLLSNAIKHTRKEGKIILRSQLGPEKGVSVCVEDDGEGIPEEYLDSIFEKFSQVKGQGYRNTHNVGLGLTFCKMAVETHGGKIWVESVVDQGSKFLFWLPLSFPEN